MPTFKVTDPQSGKTFSLTGDSAPTESELNEIFGSVQQPAPQPLQPQPQVNQQVAPNQPAGTPKVEQPQEKGFLDSVSEFFTGSDRETRATEELPELGQGGLLSGEDKVKAAAITPALLTATDPREMAEILSSNFDSIGISFDEKGNVMASNNKTGARVVLNKPGVSQIDILQGLGLGAAFTGASAVKGAAKVAGATGLTSATIEAVQALSGGEFNAEQVAIDTVTAGVLDKAFEVAKATGRNIKDVLRQDAGIDPDRIIKSFEPTGTQSSLGRPADAAEEAADIGATLSQVSQEVTPEALQRLRQAESRGVQLSGAQASKDFSAAEAEQTLLKSVSPEGEQARQFADTQQSQLKQAAEDFTNKFGGSSRFQEAGGEVAEVTARDKGEQIQSALKTTQDLGRKEVTRLYKEAADTAGEAIPLNNDSLVDIADEIIINRPATAEVKNTINTTLAKFGLIGDKVEQVSRNKFKVFDGEDSITIIGEQTPLTLSNAEEFRKALNVAVGADQTGSAKLMIGELDNQVLKVIEDGAESGRTGAFKEARSAAAQQASTFKAKDIVQDLVGFKKGTRTPTVDPETVITKIAKGDKAVTNLRKIKQVLLTDSTAETRQAWQSIKAETVGDIFGQAINKDTLEISGARLNSAIKKYKPEALRELLGAKQFGELQSLQKIIGNATISPPGTTNPSGTFLRLLNLTERLGNFAGAGQVNFGSLAAGGIKKGKELAERKKTLNSLVNTKIKKLKASDPALAKNKSALGKAARILALVEIRDLDKEGTQ